MLNRTGQWLKRHSRLITTIAALAAIVAVPLMMVLGFPGAIRDWSQLLGRGCRQPSMSEDNGPASSSEPTSETKPTEERTPAAKLGVLAYEPPPPGLSTAPPWGFALAAGKQVELAASDFHVGKSSGLLSFSGTEPDTGFCDMGLMEMALIREAPPYRDWLGATNYWRFGTRIVQGHVYCFSLGGGKFFGRLKVTDIKPERGGERIQFEYTFQSQEGNRKF